VNGSDAKASTCRESGAMSDPRDSCPPAAALIDAAAARGDRAAREQVADHLIACSRCAEEFRVLQELAPWADEHAHLIAPPGHQPARETIAIPPVWAYAAAATLAIAAVGLGVEDVRLERANRTLAAHADRTSADATAVATLMAKVEDQQRRMQEMDERLQSADAPDLNPPIIDLEALGARRSAARTPPPTIPAGARHVVFVLNTTRQAPGSIYDVEIVDGQGRVAWSGSGLKQSADGTLTLSVPRSLVTPASRLRLFSHASGRRALIEEYALPAAK
jgi:hypothetical protein